MHDIKIIEKGKMENYGQWISCIPLIGIVLSLVLLIIVILRCKPWTVSSAISVFVPVFTTGISYIILRLIVAYKYKIKISNKKMRIISLGMAAFFLIANIFYWQIRSVDFTDVTMKQLETIDIKEKAINSAPYYVIYSTENCIYCRQMKSSYEEAFLKNNSKDVYTVDLSSERTDGSEVLKKNISKLPVIVQYKGGKEIDRIEGVSTVDMLVSFINK